MMTNGVVASNPGASQRSGGTALLSGKTVLLLSPQHWGRMRISKHHYAEELARRGNRVYFVNPPAEERAFGRPEVRIRDSEVPGVRVVDHRVSVPYALKFHARWAFRLAMWPHFRSIRRAIGERIDVLWSFDISHIYPLQFFPEARFRILHPVDEPTARDDWRGARGADVLFAVTREILAGYAAAGVPRHFINHGLAAPFLALAEDERPRQEPGIRVGMSGNLLRPDIDRGTTLAIIREHPEVTFECWGNYEASSDNLGGGSDAASAFVAQLKRCPNVVLHGSVPTAELVDGYRRMDGFLIAYDVTKDPSRGTNYHKVMEFLASGSAIVSSNITTYANRPDLVQMVSERAHNHGLPALFRRVISDLSGQNSPALVRARKEYARDNTYARQVDRIEAALAQIAR